MVRFSWLALFALLASFVVFGCTPNEEDSSSNGEGTASANSTDSPGTTGDDDDDDDHDDHDDDDGNGDGDDSDDVSSAGTGMTLASNAHVDEDGDAVCPVMKGKVEDISALEPQEYGGKTYYFC